MDKQHSGARSRLSERLDIPMNYITDEPLIELHGKSRVRIENHKGIVMYTGEKIIVKSSLGTIILDGLDMQIAGIVTEEMFIEGQIEHISFGKLY
jgi:sporulation protein YqfC